VLAITDHHVRTIVEPYSDLVVIAATELDARVNGDRTAHVLALGVAADPPPRSEPFPDLGATAAWTAANGGVAFLAHPYWSGLRADDLEHSDRFAGLEVYNAGCELDVGRGLAAPYWDDLLGRGRLLFGIAADDCHHPGFDSGHAWVWARCAERSPEAVVAALAEGAFYSSCGPTIHELALGERSVEVRSSAARSVTLLAGPRRGASVHAGRLGYRARGEGLETNDDGEIIAARLERLPLTPYGRVQVVDARGRMAWTNPLWIS
jgi:hypothetical protein